MIAANIFWPLTMCVVLVYSFVADSLRPHGLEPTSSINRWLIHGILQARILEWFAISFPRGSSQPRDQTQVSHVAYIAGRLYLLSGWGMLL